ncbi:MAG: hypothetical protein JRI85_17330 [Deltaproteobacteria bacterium]|nr:hypothetical protein [Deltaproteobacteria bacterium]
MKEKVFMMVNSPRIQQHLDPSIGKDYRAINTDDLNYHHREIILPRDDPKWNYILKTCYKNMKQRDYRFGDAWATLKYEYTNTELENAVLLRLDISRQGIVIGSFREYGTIFSEKNACPKCSYGMKQESELVVRIKKSRKSDILRTVRDEVWVISDRLANILEANKVTGYKLMLVRESTPKGPISKRWHQLVVTSNVGLATEDTKWGRDPFNLNPPGHFLCKKHNVKEFFIQSELHIKKSNWDGSDFAATTTLWNVQEHIEDISDAPRPLIVISQRLYQIFRKEKIKGFNVSIVRLR